MLTKNSNPSIYSTTVVLPSLTVASDSRILQMNTVVDPESRRETRRNDALASETINVVQPDWLVGISGSEISVREGFNGRLEAQISAYDLCT